ncbi:hypothetical protein Cgig2_030654 [Carnegiea gigantea]|uniref:Uncharacterized protein n=1 Tax=Carnegiea gigantea TaxID=171969 RepID=A0A9Q1K2Y4_9CARY|nr:hypothetical protein Cgig2_030654 [Carnegiea gigantea]
MNRDWIDHPGSQPYIDGVKEQQNISFDYGKLQRPSKKRVREDAVEVLEDRESLNDVEEFDDDPDICVEEGQSPTTYENEKVLIRDKDGKTKVRGGTIFPSHVWSLPFGERFIVPFNDFYQPLRKGGHILTCFLRDITKNGDLCPIGEDNWHKQKFVLPINEIVDRKLLQCVGKVWRNHRYQLKRDHKKNQGKQSKR